MKILWIYILYYVMLCYVILYYIILYYIYFYIRNHLPGPATHKKKQKHAKLRPRGKGNF